MNEIYVFASTKSHKRTITILVTVAISLFLLIVYTKSVYVNGCRKNCLLQWKLEKKIDCPTNHTTLEEKCHWYFLNYTPSSWESMWYNKIEVLQKNVCETLSTVDNLKNAILVMERSIELQKFGRKQMNSRYNAADELFSKMFYRQQCINSYNNTYFDVAEVAHLIEPLIGLLRDPFTICPRLNSSRVPPKLYDGAILLSRRHLLLSVSAPYYITSRIQQPKIISTMLDKSYSKILPWMYRRTNVNQSDTRADRKVILLDLGSGSFGKRHVDISDTSTRWFYEYYKRFDLQFDRIIAFEIAPINAKVAWEQLPEDVFPIYTLINTGCTKNGTFNPWMTLKRLAKPSDHVIVKLDIDSYDLESFLMNQIVNDPKIHSLIDELFFEHHIRVKEMLHYWSSPRGSLQESYVLFTKLRRLGIRMHSWP